MKNTTETTGIKIDSDVKKLLADGAAFTFFREKKPGRYSRLLLVVIFFPTLPLRL